MHTTVKTTCTWIGSSRLIKTTNSHMSGVQNEWFFPLNVIFSYFFHNENCVQVQTTFSKVHGWSTEVPKT